VTADVAHDENCTTDVFVFIEADAQADTRFLGTVFSPIVRYFSNIQYAPTAGSPVLTQIDTLISYPQRALIFRFRVQLSASDIGVTSFTFPFSFAPNFFFGDVPWGVWVMADEPDGAGEPQIPPMPPSNQPEVLVGTILFEEPYFPMVGSQNVSDHYADLTGFWRAPNLDRTHSIMVLPDSTGNPPVLTVDVPLLRLCFFDNFADRGTLLMWPGAEIRVLDDDTLAIGRVDMFTCGDQVSKGIVVEQGARLDQENSTFSDAELAIHFKKGSKFEFFGSITFLNNYRGMRIDNNGSVNVPVLEAKFGPFSSFSNTAPLKLPYSGMTTPSTTKGYGLEILNHPGITMTTGTFSGLNNGVRLYRSSFVTNASFAGIRADSGSTIAHQGHAIWGLGSGAETLVFNGGGVIPLSPFGSTDNGVYLHNMNGLVNQVNMEADAGIHFQNCKLKTLRVTNCNTSGKSFKCRNRGIRSSNCQPLRPQSLISNNLFVMNNPGNTGPSGAAILLGEGAQVNTPNAIGWVIENNSLHLNSGMPRGIRALGVHESKFIDNDIEILNDDHSDIIGMDVLNTSGLTANCNKVHSALTDPQVKGYRLGNVNQSDYNCNETDQILLGMEFSTLCEGTTLKGSEFNSTPTGLLLRADVTLGTQGLDIMSPVQDHGNEWVDSEATHEATLQNIIDFSLFGVDPDENAEFLPLTNQPDWFVDEPTPTLPSFSCSGFTCLPPGAYTTGKDRNVERAVADSSIHSVGLPGVLPTMLENHLYAELQKNPLWAATDSLFYQFLQSKTGSTTEAFWELRQGMDVLDNRDNAEQATVDALEATIASLRHSLYLADSTFASGTAINGTVYSQRLAVLSAATENLRAQLDTIRFNRLTLAAQLLTENAAISTTQTWEQLQKAMNALEIQLFIQDSISAEQLEALDSIGTLCPYTHGEAIFRAQVLYNRYEEKEFYPVCQEDRGGGGGRAVENPTATLFRAYPNPSTGWITIPNPDAVMRTIQVFDIVGKMVSQVTASVSELDLSSLGNGVYLLRVKDEHTGRANTIKLVISK